MFVSSCCLNIVVHISSFLTLAGGQAFPATKTPDSVGLAIAFIVRKTPSFTSSAGKTFKLSSLDCLSQFNREVFSFSDKRAVKIYSENKPQFVFTEFEMKNDRFTSALTVTALPLRTISSADRDCIRDISLPVWKTLRHHSSTN